MRCINLLVYVAYITHVMYPTHILVGCGVQNRNVYVKIFLHGGNELDKL